MKKLEVNDFVGGKRCADAGQIFTGIMCTSTAFLIYTPFTPIAGATGAACLIGAYGGCAPA